MKNLSLDLLLKNATPEQAILWNSIFLAFGDKIAISQLYYLGQMGGTEFSIYNANKMYLCLDSWFTVDSGQAEDAARFSAIIYDRNNVESGSLNNTAMSYNTTTPAMLFLSNTIKAQNYIFSRLAFQNLFYMKFIGYRLSI